jgi:hypothetical protein
MKTKIHTAFAFDLDQDREVLRGLAIPRLEGLQQLETVGLGVNSNVHGSTVSGRWLEGIFTRIVTTWRKLIAAWVRELEGLAIRTNQ